MATLSHEAYNRYRVMWIYVLFDLPTDTKQDVRNATGFRKFLLNDGFTMFQYSVYFRHCSSRENVEVHKQRVYKNLPPKGKVCVFSVTDKQFGDMEIFYGRKPKNNESGPKQLELF